MTAAGTARTGETREEYEARRKRDRHKFDGIQFSLRLPWELHRDLHDYCAANTVGMAEVTRWALAEWLATHTDKNEVS